MLWAMMSSNPFLFMETLPPKSPNFILTALSQLGGFIVGCILSVGLGLVGYLYTREILYPFYYAYSLLPFDHSSDYIPSYLEDAVSIVFILLIIFIGYRAARKGYYSVLTGMIIGPILFAGLALIAASGLQ